VEQSSCILALDLGTSAFKAAPVTPDGLLAEPVGVAYELDTCDGAVTCPPERYYRTAMEALRRAAAAAKAAGRRVEAIGIASQAQTYVALVYDGRPIRDAVVWMDSRAAAEAERANLALPDAPAHCGFRAFSPLQFLPKLMHLHGGAAARESALAYRSHRPYQSYPTHRTAAPRNTAAMPAAPHSPTASGPAARYLLLNEYVALRLTGHAFGDETVQGMGGLFHIGRRAWSPEALALAGIFERQLAEIGPAAALSERLLPEIAAALGIGAVRVYQCGNDQACAAAGVDLGEPVGLLCNFGTAMVIYARRDVQPVSLTESQIAGIDPLTGGWFLLGLENECGNVVDRLAGQLCPGEGIKGLLQIAAQPDPYTSPPELGGRGANAELGGRGANAELAGRGANPELGTRAANQEYKANGASLEPRGTLELADTTARHSHLSIAHAAIAADHLHLGPLIAQYGGAKIAHAVLHYYRDRFCALVAELREKEAAHGRLISAGGLSRSRAWLEFLFQGLPLTLERAQTEHPALVGIARIVARQSHSDPS